MLLLRAPRTQMKYRWLIFFPLTFWRLRFQRLFSSHKDVGALFMVSFQEPLPFYYNAIL